VKGDNLLQKLHTILSKLSDEAGANFSGLGIIVCDDINKIPVAPYIHQRQVALKIAYMKIF